MLRLLFCLMLFLSVCWLSAQRASALRQKPKLLLQLADSLSVLRNEVCSRRCLLQTAFERCAELFEDTKPFYSVLSYGMRASCPLFETWRTAIDRLPQLSGEEQHYLRVLGEQLGSYDVQTQEAAFTVCIDSVRNCAAQLSADAKAKARLSVEVGAAAGLVLAIMCY